MRLILAVCWATLLVAPTAARALDPDLQVAAQKLRTYCAACHAVGGELRFIYGDDNQLWETIRTQRAPHGKLWIDAMLDVLNWPNEEPPPFDELMVPPDQDWMPKGAKRLDLASDRVDGSPARHFILETLRKNLP